MGKQDNNILNKVPELKATLKALKECETLISYAQSQGYIIPQEVFVKLNDLKTKKATLEQEARAISSRNPNGPIDIDPAAIDVAEVGSIHQALAKVIAPASPASVLLIEEHKSKGGLGILGQVPLVRRLNLITLLCLALFFALFFSPLVNSKTINGDIFNYAPKDFLLNELVIVVMAALGAAFYALFEVHKFISSKSYDPKYDSIYWIRFVLGIVSGVILAQFIFLPSEDPSAALEGIESSKELGGYLSNKPLLAFLGGFSARVVHKILNSLVESIETFISGSARDMVRAREAAAKVQMDEQINAIQQKNATNNTVDRMKATMKVMELQQQLSNGASSDHVKEKLGVIMNELMGPVSNEPFNFNDSNFPKEPMANPVHAQQNEPVLEYAHGNDVDSIDMNAFPDPMDNNDIPMPGDFDDIDLSPKDHE